MTLCARRSHPLMLVQHVSETRPTGRLKVWCYKRKRGCNGYPRTDWAPKQRAKTGGLANILNGRGTYYFLTNDYKAKKSLCLPNFYQVFSCCHTRPRHTLTLKNAQSLFFSFSHPHKMCLAITHLLLSPLSGLSPQPSFSSSRYVSVQHMSQTRPTSRLTLEPSLPHTTRFSSSPVAKERTTARRESPTAA